MPRTAIIPRIIIFILCIIFYTKAYAQNPSASKAVDAQAQNLKASFQELLDYQKTTNEILSSLDIRYDGELAIEKHKDYYTLTFPHIYISSLDNKDNQIFDIGVITLNAMADEKNPGNWNIHLTLPKEMSLYDNNKGPGDPQIFTFSIGEQRSIAYYSEKLGYFTKIDANLSALKFMLGKFETGLKIGGIQLYAKLEESENSKYSGPLHFMINNLQISPKIKKEATFDIEEIKISSIIEDFVMPNLGEYKQKIIKHKETFERINKLDEEAHEQKTDKPSSVTPKEAIDMVYDLNSFDIGSFSLAYDTKNINIQLPPKTQENQEKNDPVLETVHIAKGHFGLDFEGIKTDKGNLRIKWDMGNLKTTPPIPDLSDIIPQNAVLNIDAQNIPYKTLSTLAHNTLQNISADPKSIKTNLPIIAMRVPAIFSQAKTQILLQNANINNHIYEATTNGKAYIDMASATGFGANFNMIFKGLDKLLTPMRKLHKASNRDTINIYENILYPLETIRKMGKKSKTGDTYTLNIKLGPKGKLLFNGKPLHAD